MLFFRLATPAFLAIFTLLSLYEIPVSAQSSGGGKRFDQKVHGSEIPIPDRDWVEDFHDYQLYWAFPARVGYLVQEYSLDGTLLNSYEHDTLANAEAQKDFLETKMMLHYEIESFNHPQTWFLWDVYDRRGDAYPDQHFIEGLGLDTRIDAILQRDLRLKSIH